MNAHLELSLQRAFAHLYEGNAIEALQEFIADLQENPATREHWAIRKGLQGLADDSIRNYVHVKVFLDAVA